MRRILPLPAFVATAALVVFLAAALAGCPSTPPPLKPVPTHVDVPDKVPATRTWWTPKDQACPRYKSYFKCRKVTGAECVERQGTRHFCKS